jgi:hypothetical protein
VGLRSQAAWARATRSPDDARFDKQVKDWVDRNDALPRNANRPAAESKMAASGFGFGDLGGFRTSRF